MAATTMRTTPTPRGLTTQMFFANEQLNAKDVLFQEIPEDQRQRVVVEFRSLDGDVLTGEFTIVIDKIAAARNPDVETSSAARGERDARSSRTDCNLDAKLADAAVSWFCTAWRGRWWSGAVSSCWTPACTRSS